MKDPDAGRNGVDVLPSVAANPRWTGCACVVCGRHYDTRYEGFVCADCGIDGILDAVYEGGAGVAALVRADGDDTARGLWRFAPLLPVVPTAIHPAWAVGGTALLPAPRLAAHLGLRSLVIKDDTGLPSGSLKDRAAAVALARARQLGFDHLACASTGNAAASLAVLASRGGFRSTIYVPAGAPRGKLAQLLLHGATVIRVDGTYDQAFELSLVAIERNRWYSRNCAHNPLLVEGKKTAALELAWDLTRGFTTDADLPDVVLVPVGDGCIVSATAKAFLELKDLGLVDRVPRVVGVQAAGASPLAQAWARACASQASLDGAQVRAAIAPVAPDTIADSISVGIPRNRVKAWRYVAATGGAFVAVEDDLIIATIRDLAARAGVFAEPSGAAGLAGLVAAREAGLVDPRDRVAALVTGHGLKDPGAALGHCTMPQPVAPLS
ncbi:MAG: pyridoxal-phosphate dependent enzyme [bacterium]|nr:pyridoxal-phosphate dependent enzyme [bacterium]